MSNSSEESLAEQLRVISDEVLLKDLMGLATQELQQHLARRQEILNDPELASSQKERAARTGKEVAFELLMRGELLKDEHRAIDNAFQMYLPATVNA